MKKLSMFLCVAVAGIVHAQDQQQEKTKVDSREAYYMGAANVERVYPFRHTVDKREDSFKLAVLADGSNSNPFGSAVISMSEQEGVADPFPVHKVKLGLHSIISVIAKWHNAENSSAGGCITIRGSRKNPKTGKLEAVIVEIKYTDSTNVYLDQLEVNAYNPDKK